MKLTKKKIILIALAVCLFAIASYGTLAWFTAEDEVINKFYVGDSTTDPDKVFGIDVWETVDGVEYGKGVANTDGAEYELILPGEIFDKDPYFTNTGVHPQYVRAIVTVTDADILYDAMIPYGSSVSEWNEVEFLFPGTDANWTFQDAFYTKDDTFVYVYYYNTTLAAGATTEKLFDAVAIPTELTKEQAADIDNFTVSIVGQAIQSEHLDPAITTAQEAFKKYWDRDGSNAGLFPEDLASKTHSGNLGTPVTPIVYDPNNYTADGGVMNLNNISGTVAAGSTVVSIPATQPNSSVLIEGGANLVIEAGGYLVDAESSPNIIYINTKDTYTINGKVVGVDITQDEVTNTYFRNCTVLWMPW